MNKMEKKKSGKQIMKKCEGITTGGRPCNRYPLKGKIYCKDHLPEVIKLRRRTKPGMGKRIIEVSALSTIIITIIALLADFTGILGYFGIDVGPKETSCEVIMSSAAIYDEPIMVGSYEQIPKGTKVFVVDTVESFPISMYEISRWVYEGGQIIIGEVLSDTPADRANFKEWDIILEINGTPVKSTESVIDLVTQNLGVEILVTIHRDDEKLILPVTPEKIDGKTIIGIRFGEMPRMEGGHGYAGTVAISCNK